MSARGNAYAAFPSLTPFGARSILNRLLHHVTILNSRGESYWLKDKKAGGDGPGAPGPAL